MYIFAPDLINKRYVSHYKPTS